MKKIEVTASEQLTKLRLEGLIGKRGNTIEPNEHNTGYFIKFDEPFEGFDEWFIPNESIRYVD